MMLQFTFIKIIIIKNNNLYKSGSPGISPMIYIEVFRLIQSDSIRLII